MKTDTLTEILSKQTVAPNHILMRFACEWNPDAVQPGQFFHLRLPDTDDPLLRRPYTIYRLGDGALHALFQVIGRGTDALGRRGVGNRVNLLGPLGEGVFTLPPPGATAFVVGGGVGMASLFLLVERLKEAKILTRVLFGARSKDYILCQEDVTALGIPFQIATVDGSEGYHGLVTELLTDVLNDEPPPSPYIYTCGPTRMMEALTKITLPRGIPAQVALENRMGCALGVCLGCVVPIHTPRGMEYQRVCTEGPVFDARDVQWSYRL